MTGPTKNFTDTYIDKVFLGRLASEPTVPSGYAVIYIDDATGNFFVKESGGSPQRVNIGALLDSGTNNPSGGDIYELPQTTDSIDIQSADLDSLETGSIGNNGSRVAYPDGFENESTKAYLSATQTAVADSTVTQVEFDTTGFDVGSNFDTVNNKYVVPTDGEYLISADITYASQITDGARALTLINVDGTQVARAGKVVGGGGEDVHEDATTIESLSANDEITVDAFHTAGVNVDLVSGQEYTRLTITRL